MAERRHRFRAPSGRPVIWHPSVAPDDRHEAVLVDVSSGGARLRSARAPIHHEITLVLPTDDDLPALVAPSTLVRIEGQLKSGEFTWALAFLPTDPAAQVRLTRLVFGEARRKRPAGARPAPRAVPARERRPAIGIAAPPALAPASCVDGVRGAGGLPLVVPPIPELARDPALALDRLDGLVLAGEEELEAGPDGSGLALAREAHRRELPLLGIGRCAQLLEATCDGDAFLTEGASDGAAGAIDPTRPFCVGLLRAPDEAALDGGFPLFRGLVEAAREYAAAR